jgi:hypothetical protein
VKRAGPETGEVPEEHPESLAVPDRQRTIEALCEAFANDELSVEEFERRVETAHRSASPEELRSLLGGLPSGRALVEATARPAGVPAPATAARPPEAPAGWGFSGGIMGGMSRRGTWTPARRNLALGVMGGCTLDFREARLGPGVTEVYAVAFWGGVEVIVPPWLRVEVSGIGIMGGFDYLHDTEGAPSPDAPTLKVSGVAVMAGVEVKVRIPGESAREARKRIKEDRRARRLASGRTDPDEE